ncbi:hypothetical protein [Nocardia jiangxiensis]|uniref:hypothetical protein n=1 Tax=Nocardia jiangxiensis TaxID=282685 RepID=UPI0002FBEC7E
MRPRIVPRGRQTSGSGGNLNSVLAGTRTAASAWLRTSGSGGNLNLPGASSADAGAVWRRTSGSGGNLNGRCEQNAAVIGDLAPDLGVRRESQRDRGPQRARRDGWRRTSESGNLYGGWVVLRT